MKVLIVGGGIGGLAAALAIGRQGHEVVVLEQSRQHSEVGAAVGLGPNATAALHALDVTTELAADAVALRAWTRRRWEDGGTIGALPLGAEVRKAFGHPFWMAHRVDLLRALVRAAERHFATGGAGGIRLGTRVTDVDPATGTVTTSNGEEFQGDLVVGADGVRSQVRQLVAGDDSAVYSGNVAIRAQVPAAELREVPELRAIVEDSSLETWMGPGGHIVTSLISGGELVNITACVEGRASGSDSWFVHEGQDTLAKFTSDWYPPLRQLLTHAGSIGRWDLYDRETIEGWSLGRVVLLGDAAHPMLPYLGQGAAQTLEDAVVLGHLLDAHTAPDEVAARTAEYERRRLPRTRQAQVRSRHNRTALHLPDGEEQRERDEQYRAGAEDFEVLRWIWQPIPETREAATA